MQNHPHPFSTKGSITLSQMILSKYTTHAVLWIDLHRATITFAYFQ